MSSNRHIVITIDDAKIIARVMKASMLLTEYGNIRSPRHCTHHEAAEDAEGVMRRLVAGPEN